MAELNSFGGVMSFAIQLESQLADYYTKAGNADRAKEADKRRIKLERIRRENVVEITLEPIDGLEETPYTLNLADISPAGQQMAERIAAQFYADAAPKINVLPAQRALVRCGEEHQVLAAT